LVTVSVIQASANVTPQVSCNNASDGEIIVTANGGNGVYSYTLNGGLSQSSNVFSNLSAGTYTILVYDANGCPITLPNFTIANPALLTASAQASAQVSCYNSMDGTITITANGGTGTYLYSLNGGQSQYSNVFSNLSSGNYNVEVSDEKGCSVDLAQIHIANPSPLMVSAYASKPLTTCYNYADGEIVVSVYGGTGAYTYTLNGGQPQSSNVFTMLDAGAYIITVSDEKGCTATSETVVVASPEQITFDVRFTCTASTPAVIIDAQGGTPSYMYSIDGGQTYQASNIFYDIQTSTITVVIKDNKNCTSEPMLFYVNVPIVLEASVNILSGITCNEQNDASIEVLVTGGSLPYHYMLDSGNVVNTNIFYGLSAGDHYVIVMDSNGCYTTVPFTIESKDPIIVNLVSTTDANCLGKDDGSIEVKVDGGEAPHAYLWSNGSENLQLSGLDAGEYTLTVTDMNGCTKNFSVTIVPGSIEVPLQLNNIFSPNGDGINDLWVINNIELYPENELVVLNRWGNEVYTQSTYKNTWDGSNLLEGTYLYILKVTMCGSEVVYKNYVTIVR